MSEDYSGDFLSWLRSFYQLAEVRSFSRAADMVNRTQSTVTYQLKRLEERLGVTLVNRRVSPLALTPEGQRLYRLCQQIFGLLQQIQSEVAGGGEVQGQITIAANYGITAYYLPPRVQAFQEKYPKVSVEVLPQTIAELSKSYYSPDVDTLITQKDVLPQDAQTSMLFEADISLISPLAWDMHLSSPPKLEDFAHLPFVAFWREYPLDQRVAEAINAAGYTLKVEQYAGFFLSVLMYVSLGKGVAILDEFQARTPGFAVNVHSLQGLFAKRDYVIGHRPRQYISPQTRCFIDFLLATRHEKPTLPGCRSM